MSKITAPLILNLSTRWRRVDQTTDALFRKFLSYMFIDKKRGKKSSEVNGGKCSSKSVSSLINLKNTCCTINEKMEQHVARWEFVNWAEGGVKMRNVLCAERKRMNSICPSNAQK